MPREAFLRDALTAAESARAAGAPINPVIAAAQAALESNFGRSQLATEGRNLFGIKKGSSWTGPTLELPTKEWRNGDFYTTVAHWRKYRDWQHSVEDYGALIGRVYPHAAAVADDARAFLEQLVALDYPKYATDGSYVAKVWGIVEQFDLLDQAGPERLLLVFDAQGLEVARVALPGDADVLLRANATGTRFYVRPDTLDN